MIPKGGILLGVLSVLLWWDILFIVQNLREESLQVHVKGKIWVEVVRIKSVILIKMGLI